MTDAGVSGGGPGVRPVNVLKRLWRGFFDVDANIRWRMALAKASHDRLPLIGPPLARILDRTLLTTYGLDVYSHTVRVAALTMSHPNGILLGGNGLVSSGRVAIMSGVKLVGRNVNDPEYLTRHAEQRVFQFGDNVVIGANSVVIGPVDICDDVVIAAMSLVNASIVEPGTYAGTPVRRVRSAVPSDDWVAHLGSGPARSGDSR